MLDCTSKYRLMLSGKTMPMSRPPSITTALVLPPLTISS